MIGGAKVNATCIKTRYKLKFFSRKCDFFWGIRGKSKKFPDSKGDARHFLDSSGYAQGGEAVFGGIWRVKKKTPPYLRRLGGSVLMYNFKFPKKQAIFTDSHEKKKHFYL